MANISVIAPQLRALQAPEPLCDLQGWLIWKYEPRFEGDPKPLKVPYWADGSKRFGQQGNAHDRSKLTTFAMAREAAVRLGASGVGLALLPDWGITAFDFDNCMGPDGQMPPEVAHFASRTYTELSPSGKGARAFCFGDLGNHKTPTTPDQFGFETFHSTGFVTFTGDILPASDLLGLNNTIAPIDRYAEELCERRFSGRSAAPDPTDFMAGFEPRHGMTIGEIEALLDDLDPSMGRDDWIRVGMALHHETEGDDTGLELWNEWSSDAHNYVGREDLETQWDSFTRNAGPGRRQVTMASVKKMAATARAEEARRLSSVADVRAAAEAIVGESKTSGLSSPADFKGRFPILSAEVVGAQKPIDWLIKGVMPAADLIVLYGASTSGKTFCALELGAAIARGVDWRGRRTRKGRVLYLTAEGGGGFGKRLKAYCQHNGIALADLDLAVMMAVPNILDTEDITEVIASMMAVGQFDAIIIDTLAQVTPGADENAGSDMGRALANLRTIREVTGATVCVVHHAGKDLSRGSRGWSGIRAAADAEIEVSRDEMSGTREMRISKLKDGEDGVRFAFRLDVVTVGVDEDGDEITSCVMTEVEVQPLTKAQEAERKGIKRRGRIEAHVAEMVCTVDPDAAGMPLQDFVTLCADAWPAPEPGKRDTRRQAMTRAVHTLSREKDPPLALVKNFVNFLV